MDHSIRNSLSTLVKIQNRALIDLWLTVSMIIIPVFEINTFVCLVWILMDLAVRLGLMGLSGLITRIIIISTMQKKDIKTAHQSVNIKLLDFIKI